MSSELTQLMQEGEAIAKQLQLVRDKISIAVRREVDAISTNQTDIHSILIELALSDLECKEHFDRFPGDRHSEESKLDWSRCYTRREKAITAIKQVAMACLSCESAPDLDYGQIRVGILELVRKSRLTPGELKICGTKPAYVRHVMEKLIDSGELEVDQDLLLRVPTHVRNHAVDD